MSDPRDINLLEESVGLMMAPFIIPLQMMPTAIDDFFYVDPA